MAPSRESIAQRRVGLELRRLRAESNRTLDDVAAVMEWSVSKMSRVETGTSRVLSRDVKLLCDMYDADPGVADALVELVKQAKSNGWWAPYRDVLGNNYIPFEAQASQVHEFQMELICGLLQTAPYTRAIMRESAREDSDAEIQQRVELRLERQAALKRENDPLKLWAILSEGALRREIGGPETMRAQLLHLAEQAERPNIDVQVLPFSAGAHPLLGTTFTILHFAEADPLVFTSGVTTGREVEEPEEKRAALIAFDRLRAAAESPDQSRRIILEAAKAVS